MEEFIYITTMSKKHGQIKWRIPINDVNFGSVHNSTGLLIQTDDSDPDDNVSYWTIDGELKKATRLKLVVEDSSGHYVVDDK